MTTNVLTVDTEALSMTTESEPDGACINYERCRNIVAQGGEICAECLDEARYADDNG